MKDLTLAAAQKAARKLIGPGAYVARDQFMSGRPAWAIHDGRGVLFGLGGTLRVALRKAARAKREQETGPARRS